MHFDQIHLDKIHFGKMHLEKMPFDKMHFDKMHYDKIHFRHEPRELWLLFYYSHGLSFKKHMMRQAQMPRVTAFI